jgi:hypothetical protein
LQPQDPNRDLKLCLGLAASGALAITPLALPANALTRSIFPVAAITGSIASIAKVNTYEYQDKQNQDARERWDALKQDMDDSLLISSQAFYTANPGAWIQRREVPTQWHEQYLNARFSPLPELPAPQLEPIAQTQPQAQTIQQPGQVRGGSFDRAGAGDSSGSGWGDFEPRPVPPIAYQPQPPSFSAPIASRPTAPYEPRLFDWSLFHQVDRYPHAVVLGSTGDGKTAAQEYLARLVAGGNELHVLTTKRKNYQWVGLTPIGLGRNFAAINPVWQSFEATLNERCIDLDRAESLPKIIIAIDELNDIIGNSCVDVSNLARAGREPGLRLFLNSHSEGVEGLGLKGKNDLKSCFAWVRLGQFALRHAGQLLNKGLMSQADFEWLQQQDRPVMVDDTIAQLPDLSPGWQSRLGGSIAPTPEPTSNHLEPLTQSSFEGFNTDMVRLSNQPSNHPGSTQLALSAALEPNPEPPTDIESRFAEMKSLGMNKAQIIFMLWQVKKGNSSRYQMASEFYDRLNSKYLEISGDNAA